MEAHKHTHTEREREREREGREREHGNNAGKKKTNTQSSAKFITVCSIKVKKRAAAHRRALQIDRRLPGRIATLQLAENELTVHFSATAINTIRMRTTLHMALETYIASDLQVPKTSFCQIQLCRF